MKTLKIDTCGECYHCLEWLCVEKDKAIDDLSVIPEWCSLEDTEDKKSERDLTCQYSTCCGIDVCLSIDCESYFKKEAQND